MSIATLANKRMFLVLIIIYCIYFLLPDTHMISLDPNTIVDIGWNMASVFRYFESMLWLLFLIGYGVLGLLKIHTNISLSIAHLILILLSLYIASINNLQFEYIAIIGLLSLIIFIINIVWGICNRKNS